MNLCNFSPQLSRPTNTIFFGPPPPLKNFGYLSPDLGISWVHQLHQGFLIFFGSINSFGDSWFFKVHQLLWGFLNFLGPPTPSEIFLRFWWLTMFLIHCSSQNFSLHFFRSFFCFLYLQSRQNYTFWSANSSIFRDLSHEIRISWVHQLFQGFRLCPATPSGVFFVPNNTFQDFF